MKRGGLARRETLRWVPEGAAIDRVVVQLEADATLPRPGPLAAVPALAMMIFKLERPL